MKQREHVEQFIKKWLNSQEPDTFVRNESGNLIYTAGPSSLNLEIYFTELLEDYIDQTGSKSK